MSGGLIYSVEGFGEMIYPALRVMDTARREQILRFALYEAGYCDEAELIDSLREGCYGDAKGNLFVLGFEEK